MGGRNCFPLVRVSYVGREYRGGDPCCFHRLLDRSWYQLTGVGLWVGRGVVGAGCGWDGESVLFVLLLRREKGRVSSVGNLVTIGVANGRNEMISPNGGRGGLAPGLLGTKPPLPPFGEVQYQNTQTLYQTYNYEYSIQHPCPF